MCLHKNLRKVRLRRNTNQENKQTNKQRKANSIEKSDTLPTQPVFRKIFHK